MFPFDDVIMYLINIINIFLHGKINQRNLSDPIPYLELLEMLALLCFVMKIIFSGWFKFINHILQACFIGMGAITWLPYSPEAYALENDLLGFLAKLYKHLQISFTHNSAWRH